jgi:hypothetical protein
MYCKTSLRVSEIRNRRFTFVTTDAGGCGGGTIVDMAGTVSLLRLLGSSDCCRC